MNEESTDANRPSFVDDLPSIHWRTHRNAWLKQTGARLTIFDLLVLTTCAAAGMLIARATLEERALERFHSDPLVGLVFAVLLPCLLFGVVVGHPVVMATHCLSGRRLGISWSAGEAMGMVPAASALLLVTIALIGMTLDAWLGSAGPVDALLVVATVGVLFTNSVLPFFAAAYLVDRLTNARAVGWTDTLGLIAALVPCVTVALSWAVAWLRL